MVDLWEIVEYEGQFDLRVWLGELTVLEAIEGTEHEPNGPFWEGRRAVRFLEGR